MAQWNQPIRAQPEGKVFWYEGPDDADFVLAVMNRQVRFIFALEAEPHRRPNRPWDILNGQISRLDELVLRKEGIRISMDQHSRLWINEEDAQRFRSLLAEQYLGRLNLIELAPNLSYLVVVSPEGHSEE